jgi:hypothetical protein
MSLVSAQLYCGQCSVVSWSMLNCILVCAWLCCGLLYFLVYAQQNSGLWSVVLWHMLICILVYALLYPCLCSIVSWSMIGCILDYAQLCCGLCSVLYLPMLNCILVCAQLYPGLCSVVLWYLLCFILVCTQLQSGILHLSLAFIAERRSWNECCPLINRFLLLRKIIWNKMCQTLSKQLDNESMSSVQGVLSCIFSVEVKLVVMVNMVINNLANPTTKT